MLAISTASHENGTILSDNIFGVPGRCACWSLFVLCIDGVQNVTDKTMEALHRFFEEVTGNGNQARVISSYLLSFFVRVLYLYNRERVAHTAGEKINAGQNYTGNDRSDLCVPSLLGAAGPTRTGPIVPEKDHEFFRQNAWEARALRVEDGRGENWCSTSMPEAGVINQFSIGKRVAVSLFHRRPISKSSYASCTATPTRMGRFTMAIW